MDELERTIRELRKEYPTRYVTQTELLTAIDAFSLRVETKIEKEFARHTKEHARDTKERDLLREDVKKNTARFYSVRNWGVITQAVLSTIAAAIGVSR